ncbi:hypothetical protein [Criblamydia sequanensis]|uniref:Membrane protein n=1 Tax=Candidatus Criblamydia sequanensis CRIB-18 TaxID=1437425 RepID=A0A090D1T6_9BACT|nr:hypothetical protein [Criblamydia sequanensis]CDR34075.1 putative membrane protein [Criblamydia sequanensis CRIB-18]
MLKKTFLFLASIRFAIILILLSALMVALGTFLESKSDSHGFASEYIYSHPLFQLILIGFFINILFSALKRWPFRLRHIPFLITHLGLLMIISGTFIKNLWGLQGHLIITSGSASNKVVLSRGSYSLSVEDKNTRTIETFDLTPNILGMIPKKLKSTLFPYEIETAAFFPHGEETLFSWFKDGFLFINGLNPLPVTYWDSKKEVFPLLQLEFSKDLPLTDLYAIRSKNPEETIRSLFEKGTVFEIKVTDEDTSSYKIEFEDEDGCKLKLIFKDEIYSMLLEGPLALSFAPKKIGKGSLQSCIIQKKPLVAFIEDPENQIHFLAINSSGKIFKKVFQNELKGSFLAYQEGFSGYGLMASLPKGFFEEEVRDLTPSRFEALSIKLRPLFETDDELSLPLKLFKESAQKVDADFTFSFLSFLDLIEKENQWLFGNTLPKSLEPLFSKIDLSLIPQEFFIIAKLNHLLSDPKESLPSFLKPYASLLEGNSSSIVDLREKTLDLLSSLTSLPAFPDFSEGLTPSEKATVFSLLIRVFSLDFETLAPFWTTEEARLEDLKRYYERLRLGEKFQEEAPWLRELPLSSKSQAFLTLSKGFIGSLSSEAFTFEDYLSKAPLFFREAKPKDFDREISFETLLKPVRKKAPLPLKREDSRPLYYFAFSDSGSKNLMGVLYDPSKNGLKWPSKEGNYLFKLEPKEETLPFTLRLKEARQKKHAGTNEAFSYECRIQVNEEGQSEEYCLSMNQVFESKKGIRFYLSNITPFDESDVQTVQFAVNYDPVKGILTYPGGFLVVLGSFLLFTRKKRGR